MLQDDLTIIMNEKSWKVLCRDDINDILRILAKGAANRKARHGIFYNRQEMEELTANIQVDLVELAYTEPEKPFSEIAKKAQNRASVNQFRKHMNIVQHETTQEHSDYNYTDETTETAAENNTDIIAAMIDIENYVNGLNSIDKFCAEMILTGEKPYTAAQKAGLNKRNAYQIAAKIKSIIVSE